MSLRTALVWLRALTAAAVIVTIAACNTTGKPPAATTDTTQTPQSAKAGTVQEQEAETATSEGEPVEEEKGAEEDLVYDPDSLTFDIRLSVALRSADSVLFLKTPMGVNLNEIPDDLDKWLSRIRDKGGTVKAAPLPANGEPSRSLLGILIDVVLFFVGLVKDEIVFSAVDDFNAVMYYEEPTGDVKWIVFTRRA